MSSYHFVIFGGTGDLARRKLLPAFYDLLSGNLLPEDFKIISIGRRFRGKDEYLSALLPFIKNNIRYSFEEKNWEILRDSIVYLQMDIEEEQGYDKLKNILQKKESQRIFYMALAPHFFEPVVEHLDEKGLVENQAGMSRLVIEKPFGSDFPSARKLNNKISSVFPEENIYRIDHYLGKEMLQNILVIRFANMFFEPLWNRKYIDNIQIVSTETTGVGDRGEYYDQSGVVRDMVQNHMLQLLTITAMEPPVNMDADSIRSEKVKVLKSLKKIDENNIQQYTVRGQYGSGSVNGEEVRSYKKEDGVADDSTTETFAALKLFIDSLRWQGVPFYLKSGKRLSEKLTQITVEFKKQFHPYYQKEHPDLNPDLLVIRIQPRESVFFQFNAKEPGPQQSIVSEQMDFCQNCDPHSSTPGAYERLIRDLFAGDSTLFTRWDEVEYSWKFVDSIISAWQEQKLEFPNYKAGSEGPAAAQKMLKKDGRKWWQINPDTTGGNL